MFQYKKYSWLLTELHQHKANLKILNVIFLKHSSANSIFFTDPEGILTLHIRRSLKIKEYLGKFFTKKLASPESFDSSKPILYLVYPTYKKPITIIELKEVLKKDFKLSSVKEIIFTQDYQHESSTFYSVEIIFDGEGLKTLLYRKDYNQINILHKDFKYINLAMALTKYLVAFIEGITLKNVVRLIYEFVVDPNFVPIILCVNEIKLISPKIIALNKGVDAEGLETHVLIKSDYKGTLFEIVPSLVKEPESEATSPSPVDPSLTTSIFKHFIKQFLRGEKPRRRTIKKLSSNQLTEHNSPCIKSIQEKKLVETPVEHKVRSPKSLNSKPIKLRSSASAGDATKLPNLKSLISPKFSNKLNYLNSYKPNSTLSRFLKNEEERLLEKNSKRIVSFQLEHYGESLENSSKKKKHLKSRVYKKAKKRLIREKVLSPYLNIQVFK